nr:hypothetical protein [Tanacetum cinerariifolium]
DPGENSSQSPPHIDHQCCYGCGDLLDGIFCQRCTYESCRNSAHIGYNCPPKVPIISNLEQCYNQNIDEFPQTLPSFHLICYFGDENSFTYDSNLNFMNDSPNPPPQPPDIPIYYDDDDDDESSIPLRDIIISELPSSTELDKVIKSSVEDLVPILSESEGISDDTCDVPFCDNSLPLNVLKDHFEILSDFNKDCTSSDDDSFEDIDYVKASLPDSEPVSLEEVKDDILHQKLLNINLLIAKIKALNDNPTPDCVLNSPSLFPIPVKDNDYLFEKSNTSLSYLDNSLPEFETFSDHTEETSSGSTTTHADYSLSEYDSFLFEIEPNQGELTSVVMDGNLGEPRVPDPGENSSQSPPHIDHHCCYGCGDLLYGVFCQRCTCESCRNNAHIGYNCPPKVLIISNLEQCYNQNIDEFPQTLPSFHLTCYFGDENSLTYDSNLNFMNDSPNPPPQPPDVFDLVPILSESEGISDDTCDVPFCDNSLPLNVLNDHFEIFSDFNKDCTSSDDDSFEDIDYVEASPPDSEPVSLEEVKDDILHQKLLNINLLIAKIKALNDNPTPDYVLKSLSLFPIPVKDSDYLFEKSNTSLSYSDNSLPEFETFSDHTEETSSGSTTTHVDYSLSEYDSFLFEIEPNQGKLTSVVMDGNLGEPRVPVPNVLPTHPTLMLDSDFIPLDDSLGSDP